MYTYIYIASCEISSLIEKNTNEKQRKRQINKERVTEFTNLFVTVLHEMERKSIILLWHCPHCSCIETLFRSFFFFSI